MPGRAGAKPKLPVIREVSAGGVVFRPGADGPEVCLIAVLAGKGGGTRWQLPKGLVEQGEAPEATAVREVREETGLDARVIAPLDPIEYWFVWGEGAERARRFKRVHLYLLAFERGDVADHDREVEEARWLPIGEAIARASFKDEKRALEQARERIAARAAS